MLAPAEADLVRRDRAVPGLAVLLDPEALRGAIGEARPRGTEGVAAGPLSIRYLRYKPQTSCLVACTMEVRGERVDLYAKAYGPGGVSKLAKAWERSEVPSPIGPGRILLDHLAMVVWIFPNDGRLRALARLADSHRRARLLRKTVPDLAGDWEGTVSTLRYKPERRWVGRLANGSRARAVLRLYMPVDYAAAERATETLVSRGSLRVPRLLGRSREHCLLAVEWLAGRPLRQMAREDSDLNWNDVSGAGASLAELHGLPSQLRVRTRRAEATALHALGDWLALLLPAHAPRFHRFAQTAGARLLDSPSLDRTVHGDFYAGQVLLDDGRAVMLDLDEAVRGDPAFDVGNFIAHLDRDVLAGRLAPCRRDRVKDALLRGYLGAAGRLPERIDLYTAVGLFRLAPHPFRDHDPAWPRQVEELIGRAEVVLNGREP